MKRPLVFLLLSLSALTASARPADDLDSRFHRAAQAAARNRVDEAIELYRSIIHDFPRLPEGYNNLAVLYARQGKLEEARATLMAAFATREAYATAYENLKNLHAHMASIAYGKALGTGAAGNAPLQLALIDKVDTSRPTAGGKGEKPEREETPALQVAAAAPSVATPVAVAPPPAPEPPKVAEATRPAEPPKAVEPAPPVEPSKGKEPPKGTEPAKPVEEESKKEAETPPAAATPDKGETPPPPLSPDELRASALQTLTEWAAAWSRKDVAAYLGFYGRSFRPSNGMSRTAWQEQRNERLRRPSFIRVSIDKPRVEVVGDTATIRFEQGYEADHYRVRTFKRIELKRITKGWLITQEVEEKSLGE